MKKVNPLLTYFLSNMQKEKQALKSVLQQFPMDNFQRTTHTETTSPEQFPFGHLPTWTISPQLSKGEFSGLGIVLVRIFEGKVVRG